MKKLVMILSVMLLVTFIGFASAQVQWPDPCDPVIRDAESSTFQFQNDGVIRFPCLIAYMGYFDEAGQWHWWTTQPNQLSTYPSCLFHPAADLKPGNMFFDQSTAPGNSLPSSGNGTAWLPHLAYGNPSGEVHQRYNYPWVQNTFDMRPVIAYVFDTALHSPWGWFIRKTIYEDGMVARTLTFSLSKTVLQPQCWWEPNIANLNGPPNGPPGPGFNMPDVPWENNTAWGIVCTPQGNPPNQYVLKKPVTQLGQEITWQDIESVRIMKKNGTIYEEVEALNLTEPVDNYVKFVLANFDPQRSWLNTTCLPNAPLFSCDVYVHETNATITGIEPQTGETYALFVKLFNEDAEIRSPDWTVPVTMDLKAVPKDTKKTITNKNGKITTTGSIVPAIEFTEREDGSLLVQYIEPFIEVQPPALQTNPYQPNAWRGTQIRFGLANKPTEQFHNPSDPVILLWPNIPSNVGTVIFPKEYVNRLKSSPGFTGTAYVNLQHRDQFGIKRWQTGTGFFPYQFKNPNVVP